ncbi:MAG TPA: dCTP deaminase [Candidatus Acidoferrum sp.]|nr:dCTP deaminase [Candidatus Acidoferrum sp.]
MILSDIDIKNAQAAGVLGIEPFDENRLKQASYVLSLGAKLLIPKPLLLGQIVEPGKTEVAYDEITVGDKGYILRPGKFVLGSVMERLRIPTSMCAWLDSRTDLVRLGVCVLQGSTFIEPGQSGSHETLEITNLGPYPVRLTAGMKIVKIIFEQLQTPASHAYDGSYAGQRDGRVQV